MVTRSIHLVFIGISIYKLTPVDGTIETSILCGVSNCCRLPNRLKCKPGLTGESFLRITAELKYTTEYTREENGRNEMACKKHRAPL